MSPISRKLELRIQLAEVRRRTLALLDRVPDEFLKQRVHDFYSPVGWHFGHVGMTEEYWVCVRATGRQPRDERLSFLFANLPENPRDQRVHLPSREEIVSYLAATRVDALEALEAADLSSGDPLLRDGYAWEFALQHECQHQETIAELLQLIRQRTPPLPLDDEEAGTLLAHSPEPPGARLIPLPGGLFEMGSNGPHRYDNERRAHTVKIAPFDLAELPVTATQWARFILDGGYVRQELWSEEGWAWRCEEDARMPEYWRAAGSRGQGFAYVSASGLRSIDPHEPVTSISWFEADAFSRWAGLRLPAESEWEYAAAFDPATGRARRYPWGDDENGASQADYGLHGTGPRPAGPDIPTNALGLRGMAGGAWEWTSTPFLPYPGFRAYPYDGYSLEHMDGNHRVCRGGSWATAAPILRCTFRNWYVPGYRQGFLGMRCAR